MCGSASEAVARRGSREGLSGSGKRRGDILGLHGWAQLPGDDGAREVVENGQQVEPANECVTHGSRGPLNIFETHFMRSSFDDVTGPGGAREAPRAARSEAQESLFEAVEEGARVRLGHAVHVV